MVKEYTVEIQGHPLWPVMAWLAILTLVICGFTYDAATSRHEHESYREYMKKASDTRPLTFEEWKGIEE